MQLSGASIQTKSSPATSNPESPRCCEGRLIYTDFLYRLHLITKHESNEAEDLTVFCRTSVTPLNSVVGPKPRCVINHCMSMNITVPDINRLPIRTFPLACLSHRPVKTMMVIMFKLCIHLALIYLNKEVIYLLIILVRTIKQ